MNFSCTPADCLFCTWPELCLASKLLWVGKRLTTVAKAMSRNLKLLPQMISAESSCVHLCLIKSKAQIPKP